VQWTASRWRDCGSRRRAVWCRSRNDFQWSESKIDVPLTLRNVAPMLERNEANPPLNRQQPKRQSNAAQRNATQRNAAVSPVICSGEPSRWDCVQCAPPFSVRHCRRCTSHPMRPASTSLTRLSLRGTACALRRSPLHAACATCRVACCLRHVSRCMLLAGVRHSGNARPRPRPRCACRGDGYRPATAYCAVRCSGRQCTHRCVAPVARTGRTHRYRFSDFLSPRAPVLTALPIPHKLLGPIEQALTNACRLAKPTASTALRDGLLAAMST
jgi:hypothetical protein